MNSGQLHLQFVARKTAKFNHLAAEWRRTYATLVISFSYTKPAGRRERKQTHTHSTHAHTHTLNTRSHSHTHTQHTHTHTLNTRSHSNTQHALTLIHTLNKRSHSTHAHIHTHTHTHSHSKHAHTHTLNTRLHTHSLITRSHSHTITHTHAHTILHTNALTLMLVWFTADEHIWCKAVHTAGVMMHETIQYNYCIAFTQHTKYFRIKCKYILLCCVSCVRTIIVDALKTKSLNKYPWQLRQVRLSLAVSLQHTNAHWLWLNCDTKNGHFMFWDDMNQEWNHMKGFWESRLISKSPIRFHTKYGLHRKKKGGVHVWV